MTQDDSSSLDPYRPPEAVQRTEVRLDDPDWVGQSSTCKSCKREFVVENKYRRFSCEDCDSKAGVRGWLILFVLFVIYMFGQVGLFVIGLLAGH